MIVTGVFYQVNETEQVIITRFGQPVGGAITTPGLHLKMPFIHKVRRFEKRILEWDGSPEQIPTLDKRFLLLDTTARWRISDPLRFLQAVGDERSAHSRLDDLIDSAARDVVSGHLLIQAVRNFTRELPVGEDEGGAAARQTAPADGAATAGVPVLKPEVAVPTVPETAVPRAEEQTVAPEERLGRDRLTALMVDRARQTLPNLGIELIDVRIRRINYVQEVEKRVYERMVSERKRIAARFRSEGDGASAKIHGERDRALAQIRSEAYRRAQEIQGKADAEAARIYAEAYGQNAEFYAFFQTLEAYKQTVSKNSSLLLTTESDFYRYLNDVSGLAPQNKTDKSAVAPHPPALPPVAPARSINPPLAPLHSDGGSGQNK
jgi:membrane protease subunit HflC